ncbi:MAG: helix-turn-helix domain-containing protein [Candidatus Bathyarchaeota archaeon]|nr:helix-turn-helix domain-containing protein [Candidatus Bathyarchaeota archaeon]
MKRISEENLSKILKELLFKDADSLSELSERVKLTKPTVMRGVNELEAHGFLETAKDQKDKRNLPPRKIQLKERGFVYLIISEKMTDEELEAGFKGYCREQKAPSLLIEGTKGSLKIIADEIRPKVNPKFLNDEYARTVIRNARIKQLLTPPSKIPGHTEEMNKIMIGYIQNQPKEVNEFISFLESYVKQLEVEYSNAKNIVEGFKKIRTRFNKKKGDNIVTVRTTPGFTDPAQTDGGVCRPHKS